MPNTQSISGDPGGAPESAIAEVVRLHLCIWNSQPVEVLCHGNVRYSNGTPQCLQYLAIKSMDGCYCAVTYTVILKSEPAEHSKFI